MEINRDSQKVISNFLLIYTIHFSHLFYISSQFAGDKIFNMSTYIFFAIFSLALLLFAKCVSSKTILCITRSDEPFDFQQRGAWCLLPVLAPLWPNCMTFINNLTFYLFLFIFKSSLSFITKLRRRQRDSPVSPALICA